jgi:hypothetical protein
MKNIGHRFSSLATVLLIVSSAATFAHDNRVKDNQDGAQNDGKAVLWHARGNGNGCAVGNSPPPGTNC